MSEGPSRAANSHNKCIMLYVCVHNMHFFGLGQITHHHISLVLICCCCLWCFLSVLFCLLICLFLLINKINIVSPPLSLIAHFFFHSFTIEWMVMCICQDEAKTTSSPSIQTNIQRWCAPHSESEQQSKQPFFFPFRSPGTWSLHFPL